VTTGGPKVSLNDPGNTPKIAGGGRGGGCLSCSVKTPIGKLRTEGDDKLGEKMEKRGGGGGGL